MKLIFVLIFCLLANAAFAANMIIILVPGMGQGVISAAEAYQFGNKGQSFGGEYLLKMERLPGEAKLLKDADDDTLSVVSFIAAGVKSRGGSCGVDLQGIPYNNICEIAAEKKLKCGVISTGRYDSPAVAAMYAHTDNLTVNAKSQFLNARFDLFIAAGYEPPADFTGKVIKKRDEYKDLILPVYGILLNNGLKQRGIDGTKADPAEPTLPEMTEAAINALANKNGFLLVIDAAGIEKAVDAKDAGLWIGELLGVEKTLDSIQKWVVSHGGWAENNLLIIGLNEKGITSVQAGAPGTVPKVNFYGTDYINSMTPVFYQGKIADKIKASFTADRTYKKEMKVITPQRLFFLIADIL